MDKLSSSPPSSTEENGDEFTTNSAPAQIDHDEVSAKRPVDVMFRLQQQSNLYFLKPFVEGMTVGRVKSDLSKMLKTTEEQLSISKDGTDLLDDFVLSDVPMTKGLNFIEVCLASTTPIDITDIENIDIALPQKKKIENVTIKFLISKQNQVMTRAYHSDLTVREVKEDLCAIFSIKYENLILTRNDKVINDGAQLKNLDYDTYGNIEVAVMTCNNAHLNLDAVYKDVPIHDILTVTVPLGDDTFRVLTVEVTNAAVRKPYLGGFRNVNTGLEYHHAYTQTPPRKERVKPAKKTCRDTQTVYEKDRIHDTHYSRSTQMTIDRLYIPCVTDTLVEPKKYETYDELVARLRHDHHATVIQRSYRSHRFRKQVFNWVQDCKQMKEKIENEKLADFIAREKRITKEAITKTFPRSREDFDQLYSMVDRWRNSEIARISALHSKGPKVAEFTLLLDKEVELLRAIERYRIQLKEDMKIVKNRHFLEEISKPTTWRDPKGNIISMDTLEAQWARKLKELYYSVCRTDLSVEERLELIVNLKYTLKDYRFAATKELDELLDRECDLIVRNYSAEDMQFLRKRIQSTILHCIKVSEAKWWRNLQKKKHASTLHYCDSCRMCKSQSEFPLTSRSKSVQVCSSCSWGSVGATWIDMTPYKFMLEAIRKDERKRRAWTSLAFVLQDEDIHFLVDRIWHCHSVLSESSDIFDLRFVRWYKDIEWSPWNCVLLHVTEIDCHMKMANPDEVYDIAVVNRVKARHISAKTHFHQLAQ